jgi:hypothetical protein
MTGSTLSGLTEMEFMPAFTRKTENPGWSLGAWPHKPILRFFCAPPQSGGQSIHRGLATRVHYQPGIDLARKPGYFPVKIGRHSRRRQTSAGNDVGRFNLHLPELIEAAVPFLLLHLWARHPEAVLPTAFPSVHSKVFKGKILNSHRSMVNVFFIEQRDQHISRRSAGAVYCSRLSAQTLDGPGDIYTRLPARAQVFRNEASVRKQRFGPPYFYR